MLPASAIGGLVGMVIGLIGADFDYSLSFHDYSICFLWGGIIVTAAHYLFILGSRHILGAEIMLITLIEFILGPVWVWLIFREQPTLAVLMGGTLVLLAVTGRSVVLIRQHRLST